MAKRSSTKNLEEALDMIESDEVRTKTLYKIIEKHQGKIKIPDPYVDEAIEYCQQQAKEKLAKVTAGSTLTFAAKTFLEYGVQIAEQAGRTEKAQELYAALSKLFEKYLLNEREAAKAAQKAGLPTKAKKLYHKVIKSAENKQEFSYAAEVANEAGLTEQAKAYQTLDKLLK